MKATNAERVASHIKEHGPGGILIHTLPGTAFWLVCQLSKKNQMWNITLCHPSQTKAYRIATDISDDRHFEIWNELVKIELSRRVGGTARGSDIRPILEKYISKI